MSSSAVASSLRRKRGRRHRVGRRVTTPWPGSDLTPSSVGVQGRKLALEPPLGVLRGDALVVADHLGDDEVAELLGELGVQAGALRETLQAVDLLPVARRV